MLRRKPTAITISSEDLAAFEDARLRHKAKENNGQDAEAISDNSKANAFDPNDELKPLPGDKARIVRSREERIGVSRRG
ncbi:anaphase-promoting complex, subunit CDC26 [Thermoascus aurantiacus ATCC 26904]